MHPGSGTLLAFSKRLFVNITSYIRGCRRSAQLGLVHLRAVDDPSSIKNRWAWLICIHNHLLQSIAWFGIIEKSWVIKKTLLQSILTKHQNKKASKHFNYLRFSYFNHSVNYSIVFCVNIIRQHEGLNTECCLLGKSSEYIESKNTGSANQIYQHETFEIIRAVFFGFLPKVRVEYRLQSHIWRCNMGQELNCLLSNSFFFLFSITNWQPLRHRHRRLRSLL